MYFCKHTLVLLHSSQSVPVTQLALRMRESVTVTLISLPVSLPVSVGVSYMWKENIVIFAKKGSTV